VVKSLRGFACGPVVLLHTQDLGIKLKKPTCDGLRSVRAGIVAEFSTSLAQVSTVVIQQKQ
jgi:hypothetical protein